MPDAPYVMDWWPPEACRWRVGRKVGRTIYTVDDPKTGDGRLIGLMDSKAIAEEAVAAHNARLDGAVPG